MAGKKKPAMELVEGEVWCDQHGCIHKDDPEAYDYGDRCNPKDWRKLWAGAYVKPKEK